ncbi:MAG: hypothetical protein JXP34_14790, partial [Planctomycetes bacterium]|nr:hypothetical protein [Planctomycetota bacterium]
DIGGKVAAAHVARLEAARKMLEATLPDEKGLGRQQEGREADGGGGTDERRRDAGPGPSSGGASIGKDDGGSARK